MVATSSGAPVVALLVFLMINGAQASSGVCSTHVCVGVNNVCEDVGGKAECNCVDPYVKDGDNCKLKDGIIKCSSVSDCNPNRATCKPYSEAEDFNFCECIPGYEGNGIECTVIDYCTMRDDCSEFADCQNDPDKQDRVCSCRAGYSGDGFQCTSICIYDSDCGLNEFCKSNRKCGCLQGYALVGGVCQDIDECSDPELYECDPSKQCFNILGGYECACPNGQGENDQGICVDLYPDCQALLDNSNPKIVTGQYDIDPDGTGDKKKIRVTCTVIGNLAITQVDIVGGTKPTPASGGKTITITYNEDVSELIKNSDSCSQQMRLDCGKKFKAPITWTYGEGAESKNWGGDGDGECACSTLGKCTGCYCGHNNEATDIFFITDKDKLPVTSLTFSGSGNVGSVVVGPLQCGSSPYYPDLPKDCNDAKKKYDLATDQAVYIDIDGAGPTEPFLAFCNIEQYRHVGIIQVEPKKTTYKSTGSSTKVEYLGPEDFMTEIIKGSLFCSQQIEYSCASSKMSAAGYEVIAGSEDNKLSPEQTCLCVPTGTCTSCHCDKKSGVKDLGLILDYTNLPVLSVKSTTDENEFTIGPLMCAPKQFGIEPNCEKVNQGGEKESGQYYIDPDGPEGDLKPFPVTCEMDEHLGTTVVQHDQFEQELDFSTNNKYNLVYNSVSTPQLDALRERSKVCSQTIKFTGCTTVQLSSFTFNGNMGFDLGNQCPDGMCPCDTDLRHQDEYKSAITSIKGTPPAKLTIGNLRCTEIFEDCQAFDHFRKNGGVEGEAKLSTENEVRLTIDPDGTGIGEPMVIQCKFQSETVIPKPKIPDPVIVIKRRDTEPVTECTDLEYSDSIGEGIAPAQLATLVGLGRQCEQSISFTCKNAPITGEVNYTTCAGDTFTAFVDPSVSTTCSCGNTTTCTNKDDVCNCDSSEADAPNKLLTDDNPIIANAMLPICQVCMRLDTYDNAGRTVPLNERRLRFDVSPLQCGKGRGRSKTCNQLRTEVTYNSITEKTEVLQWLKGPNGQPILVSCTFYPYPTYGEMAIKPKDPIVIPEDSTVTDELIVEYNVVEISHIRDLANASNYCQQDILVFCPTGGVQGLYSGEIELTQDDYTYEELTADEVTKVCERSELADLCKACSTIKRVNMVDKELVPLKRIDIQSMGAAFGDATCGYLEKDCEAIRVKGLEKKSKLSSGFYPIDPDQAGPLPPFEVECEFYDDTAVTLVRPDETWKEEPGKAGEPGDGGADFVFKHKYPFADPDQIVSLIDNSEFCWQGVKYTCTGTGNKLFGRDNQRIGFGTGPHGENESPCACDVLNTCDNGQNAVCDCNSEGSMVNQGFVTSDDLPITKFSGSESSNLALTDLRCTHKIVDLPKDCTEALAWGERHGVNWATAQEVLINPGQSEPMLVYCDFNLSPGNPVTIIKTTPTTEQTVTPGVTNVTYRTPGNPSSEQLTDVIARHEYCYQPIKINCYAAAFLNAGVRYFFALSDDEQDMWSADPDYTGPICTCGTEQKCGGVTDRTTQLATKCNCDIGDNDWRRDAAIVDVKKKGPFAGLDTKDLYDPATGARLNLTIGDVFCANEKLIFNECDMDFHDCYHAAVCINKEVGYSCECPDGWTGTSADPTKPVANGRQCFDSDECARGFPCKLHSDCENNPGSFDCVCHQGFERYNKTACQDFNECDNNENNNCDKDATCINTEGAYLCKCNKGFRGDGTEGNCTPFGQCSCFGDPHCTSFDAKWNHYMGVCEYVLATNECPGANPGTTFTVTTTNWNKDREGINHVTWIKEITIYIYGVKIVIGQGRSVQVDNTVVTKNTFRKLSDDKTQELIKIKRTRFEVQVTTLYDLTVTFDGDEKVKIDLPTSMKGTVCGTCGNFNDDPDDDWKMGKQCTAEKENTLATDVTVFGDSWTSDTCKPDCTPSPPPPDCSQPKSEVENLCNMLFDSETTSDCLKSMDKNDKEEFNRSCHIDLCVAKNSKQMSEHLCKVAKAMGQHCDNRLGVIADTSSDTRLCSEKPNCGDNEEFTTCGVMPSCENRKPVNTNCIKGCICVQGYVKNDTKCILESECGCNNNGTPMKTEQTVLSENCQKISKCLADGSVKHDNHSCGENERCDVVEGQEECVDPCHGVTCTEPNTECLDGHCVCLEGHIANCGACEDIDECETGENNCTHPGQKCKNLPGSYECECMDGYEELPDGTCKDKNECEDVTIDCGNHAECKNLPGTYKCECCMGYSMEDGVCHRDMSQDVYGQIGQECCSCSGPRCEDPEPVCGTDGNTYPNYKTLVTQSCMNKEDVQMNYMGPCQDQCDKVECERPFETCSETGPGGAPKCSCPNCTADAERNTHFVCGTNRLIYETVCEFELTMCETENHDVELEESMSSCEGPGGPPEWSDWGECNNTCGKGVQTRTRVVDGITEEETATCYTTCNEGPCTKDKCHNPGQLCMVDESGAVVCECPDCTDAPTDYICGQVGNKVQTFANECLMRKKACELIRYYAKLEDGPCAVKPKKSCRKKRNFATLKDEDGCKTDGTLDLGYCGGGCRKIGGRCCRPVRNADNSPLQTADLTYTCPDGTTKTRKEEVITKCECMVESQHDRDRR